MVGARPLALLSQELQYLRQDRGKESLEVSECPPFAPPPPQGGNAPPFSWGGGKSGRGGLPQVQIPFGGGGDVQYCAGLLYFDEGLAKTTSSSSLISRFIKFLFFSIILTLRYNKSIIPSTFFL